MLFRSLFCEKLGKGDRRLEHIGDLLKSAKVVEPPAGKGKVYHAQTIIQARRLDTWFAPFVKPDKDK